MRYDIYIYTSLGAKGLITEYGCVQPAIYTALNKCQAISLPPSISMAFIAGCAEILNIGIFCPLS